MSRSALLVLLTALLVLPSSAQAGTYDVVACAGSVGGVADAFTSVADPGMSAYKGCPNTPSNPLSGLVTRASASSGPARVPMSAGAYQIFEAPPGARLEGVNFDVAAIRLAGYWTTGIVAYDGNFNAGDLPWGCYAGQAGCTIGTPAFFGPNHADLHGRARFRFETRCNEPTGCDVSASGGSIGTRALFSAANVVVRVSDSTVPAIVTDSGALWQQGWHRGTVDGWQQLYDNVGIMGLRLYTDGALKWAQDFREPSWPAGIRCEFTRARPCNDITPGGVVLDTRTLNDGDHSIRVEAIDAAGNVSAIERPFLTDNNAPPPVDAAVLGGEDWRRTNDFAIRWQSRDAGGGSSISKMHYSLCPVSPGPACTRATNESGDTGALDGVRVPGPGEYELHVWLEDAAGNTSEANASADVRLRMDDAAPDGEFELMDETDPSRLDVRVTDVGSGVADGAIELRRFGQRQWHELQTTLGGGALHAHVDDSGLPDGDYEARALVRDRAGNERVTDRREDGTHMSLSLPLRAQSRIALNTALLRGTGTVHGKLTGGGGGALGHAPVSVMEQSRSPAVSRRAQTILTDSNGDFDLTVGDGTSRSLRFQFGGSPFLKPSAAEVNVLVAARSTIAVSRRRLRNGQTVRFTGRLVGKPVPDGGKLIDLQAFYRKRWRTIATPRANQAGNWRFRYRFEATSGLVRYRFRARIRREAAYPYELGYSRVARVTVKGP